MKMSLSKIDVCGDLCSNDESTNYKESKIEIQDDQEAADDNIIYKQNNDISNKNINNMDLQNKLDLENDKIEMKTFDIPSDLAINNEYDAFASDNKIYRKYKLRQRKSTKIFSSEEENVNVVSNTHQNSARITIKLDEAYTCPYCFINFTSKTRYATHVLSHEKSMSYICSQCSAVFMSNADLISHKDIHKDNTNVHCCESCKLAFSDYCDFLKHKTTHKINKQYKCPECGYICLNKYYIQVHIEIHFNRKLKCNICTKMVQSIKLQSHLRKHTLKFQCVECGKQCNCQSSYKYHMSTHTGVKSYQCLYCGKGFLNNSQRKVHTRIHTNEKRYECTVCFEKFRQMTDLKRHTVTHEMDRKHECNVCGKKFFHKDYLDKTHMKKHLNKLDYKCSLCVKCFQNKAGLKSHILHAHTNERPFECKPCNMSFANKGHYNRHCSSLRHKNH